jgi:YD repeat-containing protein
MILKISNEQYVLLPSQIDSDLAALPEVAPQGTDWVLVSEMEYSAAGDVARTIDPSGMATCMQYDAAGRETVKILNCSAGAGSSSSSSSGSATSGGCPPSDDAQIRVLTAYNADGNVSSITAVNRSTGDQLTQYVYGTTLSDSDLASSQLKRYEVLPDSVGGSDRLSFAYNRQGEVIQVTDQNGTVHAYDYDLLGRKTQDRVTVLGTGVDGAVRRIATTYEVRGMVASVTSYDNATVGSGSIANQDAMQYDEFGQLVSEAQSHSGAVTGSTPQVQYAYEDGSANTIRQTAMTYPHGRVLTYSYGVSAGMDDALGRPMSSGQTFAKIDIQNASKEPDPCKSQGRSGMCLIRDGRRNRDMRP